MRAAALGVVLAACALPPASGPPAPHRPDRVDYLAFREAHADLLEPNCLPSMLHRLPREGPEGDLLILCHWDAEQMPIDIAIDLPAIPAAPSRVHSGGPSASWNPRHSAATAAGVGSAAGVTGHGVHR